MQGGDKKIFGEDKNIFILPSTNKNQNTRTRRFNASLLEKIKTMSYSKIIFRTSVDPSALRRVKKRKIAL